MNLSPWGPVAVAGRLGGGHRNEVLELRRGGERLVARRSSRSDAALAWELELLEFLAGHGFRVPPVVPAIDGRRQVDGVVVQRWLAGRPPGAADWSAVAAELRRLHAVTAGWSQRPGFLSCRDLLTASRGGDVDLDAMPAAAVATCRRAWGALSGSIAVVHGDPCAANVRIGAAGVGFLDWDESRMDHPDLDLADVPGVLPRGHAARAAVDAWEAAAGWLVEPEYARGRLARLG